MSFTGDTNFVDGLTEEQKKPHKLCSVYPRPLTISHWTNGGAYAIPAPAPGEAYSYVEVPPGETRYDLGNGQRFISLDIPSAEMARDIMGLNTERKIFDKDTGQWKTIPARTRSPYQDMGLFVPAGDVPTEEEIGAARARLIAFFNAKLIEGDLEYQRSGGKSSHVEEVCRIAAEFLKADKPWNGRIGEVQDKINCPVCKEKINRGATKCVHCASRIGYGPDGRAFELVKAEAPPEPVAVAAGRK